MSSAPSFKMLWFELCGLSLTASAHHFLNIRDVARLPEGTSVIELCDVLGLDAVQSAQVGSVPHPGGDGMLWLGLGERATLWECPAHNILVFPPWLRQDWSRTILPACLADAAPHHDGLTWILDVDHIARTVASSKEA